MREDGGSTVHFLLDWSCCCTHPFPPSVTLYPPPPIPLCFPSRVRTGAAGFGTDRACLVLVTWRFLRMRLCECVARIASLRRPTTSPFTPFFAMPFFGVLCVYPSRLFLFVLWPAQDFSNCWLRNLGDASVLPLEIRVRSYCSLQPLILCKFVYMPSGECVIFRLRLSSSRLCSDLEIRAPCKEVWADPGICQLVFHPCFQTRGAKNLLADQGLVKFDFYVDKVSYQQYAYHHLFSKHVCIIKRYNIQHCYVKKNYVYETVPLHCF